MAQRNGNYVDENGKAVEGAEVYVYNKDGTTATLTDTDDQPITHPVITDQEGNYAYRAADGYYLEHVWFGKRRVRIENGIFIGDPNLSLQLANDAVVEAAGEVLVGVEQVAADREAAEAAAGLSVSAKQGSEAAQGAAEDAAAAAAASLQAAMAAGRVFDDEAAALAGTAPGDNLFLREDGNFVEYINNSDTSLDATGVTVAGAAALFTAVSDVQSAAATVGIESGNPNARVAFGGISADTVSQRAVGVYGVREKALVSNRIMSALMAKMWRNVRFIGHSAVAGSGVAAAGSTVNPRSGINGSIPRHLEYLLQQFDPEWCVSNRGQSAQTSSEIASRMGAIPINITLASGTTLASSGAVTCTCSPGAFGPSSRRGTSADDYYGKIGTQACILRNTGTGPNANSPIYSIEQSGGTGTITVNPGTPFILDADPQDYAINIFWATRNDNNNQLSWDMQAAMVDKLPQDERRFIVMGDWPFALATPSEDNPSTRYTNIMAENAELRRRYGANFFDVYAFLRGEYPYDGTLYRSVWQMTGETAGQSANDWPDQAAGAWVATGRIPRRWYSLYIAGTDSGHFNEQTYYWLAQALIEFHFVQKGWLL